VKLGSILRQRGGFHSALGISSVIASVLTLAVGCGGSSGTSNGGSGSGPSGSSSAFQSHLTSPQLCDKLQPSTLDNITGDTWAPPTVTTPSGPGSNLVAVCGLSSTIESGSAAALNVTIQNQNGPTVYQATLKSPTLHLSSIAGVGDEAAFGTSQASSVALDVLVVRRGDSVYELFLNSPHAPGAKGLDPLKKIYALVTS
jgi:hypothetical protein